MITPNEKIYWKSICRDGIEIASINLSLIGSEMQLLTYSNKENDESFLFNGFCYIGAQNIVCLDMKIDINPNDFDKTLKRIKKLLIFS